MRNGDLLRPDDRSVPIRRLSPDEADLTGFAGPLQLSRVQFGRFGWWRNSKWYVVETPRGQRLLVVNARELRQLGIEPDGR